MTTTTAKPLVLIGTSGSGGYLDDATGSRRFWDLPSPDAEPVSPEDSARLDAYLAATSGSVSPVPTIADGEEDGACDGVHDEGAPAHYLCTRCFPDLVDHALRGDLVDPPDDDGYDVCGDEDGRDGVETVCRS